MQFPHRLTPFLVKRIIMNAVSKISEVSVIGLGSMGTTLAQLYLDQGYKVTVWNRTPEKAAALVAQGAVLARNAATAVRASPAVVMCVYDYKAADAVLGLPDVAAAIASRLLLQLTTGSPQDARNSEAWTLQHGARYLDGAIQAGPSQMGKPDTPLLLSGAEASYREAEPLLKVLAGNVIYLGAKISAAAAMDLATLSYVYGAILGFLHGARVSEAEGFDVAQYGEIVNGIAPTFGAFLQHEGKVIRSGVFTISESPLRISVEATQRLLDTAREAGINTEFPAFASGLFQRADAAGLGGEELAAMIKLLRA
jgi:3-hydroxyisobutyrate dehydrogenase-like beta-hydroxyacid dehydrogenase